MYGFFLSILVFCNADLSWKEPKLFYDNYVYQKSTTTIIYGTIEESSNGNLVFSHMPVGKYKNAIVYKHEMMFQKHEAKLIAHDNIEKTAKIVGQIISRSSSQGIPPDFSRGRNWLINKILVEKIIQPTI